MQVSRAGSVNDGVLSAYSYDKVGNRANVAVTIPIILYANQAIWSSDWRFQLIMQSDGNLVLYGPDGYMWATATNGGADRRMVMQPDGNLVVYNGASQALWASNTGGNPGARLDLQTDGNLVIYSATNAVLWHANTPYAPPSFSIADAVATEGGRLNFTVTRSKATTATYTVNFATANGSALAASDYNAGSGALSFAPSEMTRTIAIDTIDDGAYEGTENLYVNLSGPSGGATISDGQAIGTINDNDAAPSCNGISFSVSDAAAEEMTALSFTVTKTGSTTISCSVNYATANGSAVSTSDYTAASGTLSFSANETVKTVNIATSRANGDFESTENMALNLSGQSAGAGISDAQGIGTIYNYVPEDPGGGCPPQGCPLSGS